MKRTKTIDRKLTIKDDRSYEGLVIENMVSTETCSTTKLFGTYVVIKPGSRSPMRSHEESELAWYLVKGKVKHILVIGKDKVITETICGTGAAGYVSPGDAHQEINLSETEPAEFIMAYANPDNKICNSMECTGTKLFK